MSYFQKRELEWQKQQIKDDKRRMAEIKAMMVELQDAIQEEIERNWYVFSSGQGISMEEAYKRSNELDVVRFAKKAKKYVKNRDFSPQANKELKLYNLTMRVNRLELLKANIGLEIIRTFDEIDKYVSNELTTVAKEEMKRQAGILYIDVSKNEYTSMLKQIANGSFQGVEFSNLIWSYQNELKADLSKLLQRSIVLGRNPKMLAPELKKYLTEEGKLNAKFNTQRLMVSETTNIQIAIQKQSYLDAGIEKYGYNAEPSACSVGAKLKDKTFLVSEMMPGKNAPSMHPFCRCSTYPVVEMNHVVDKLKTGKTDNDELNSSNERSIIELGAMYKKSPYRGIYINATIPRKLSAIRRLIHDAGISLEGIKIKLESDESWLGSGMLARADGQHIGRVDLLPDAFFLSEEEFLKTIVHEREHVRQYRKYGARFVQNNMLRFEREAVEAENKWVAEYRKRKKGRK